MVNKRSVLLVLGTVYCFIIVCLGAASTARMTADFLVVCAIMCAIFFHKKLGTRLSLPVGIMGLILGLDLLSCLYAPARVLALSECAKVTSAFCLMIILLSLMGDNPMEQISLVLCGVTALAGLVGILAAAGVPVFPLLSKLSPTYSARQVVESGVRVIGLSYSVNAAAAWSCLGVFLCLGVLTGCGRGMKRVLVMTCLAVNAMAFTLAFSMGTIVFAVPAFVLFLVLERAERRWQVLISTFEAVLAVLVSMAVSGSLLSGADGIKTGSLLVIVCGVIGVCALDYFIVGCIKTRALVFKKKTVTFTVVGVVALLFAVLNLTGGANLKPGEVMKRTVVLKPGQYVLVVDGDMDDVKVQIRTQTYKQAALAQRCLIYSDYADGAEFCVPEDCIAVSFFIASESGGRLTSLTYHGDKGSGSVPLEYLLLPDFAANRIQGLWAGQNLIRRLDTMRLGLWLGMYKPWTGFGVGYFEYVAREWGIYTKYVHNQYIQAFLETGVLGVILFVGLQAVSIAYVLKGRKRGVALAPAIGACVMFMMLHGAFDVEFSDYVFLPIAFGVYALAGLCGVMTSGSQ